MYDNIQKKSNEIQSKLFAEIAQGIEKMWPFKAGGLLTQVNYREMCTFWGLKGWSLRTGGI